MEERFKKNHQHHQGYILRQRTHSAWVPGQACALTALVGTMSAENRRLVLLPRGLRGWEACAQLLRRLGSQSQRRTDRRFDLEASLMSGQRRSEGRVGLQIVELAQPPSWTVGSLSCDAIAC